MVTKKNKINIEYANPDDLLLRSNNPRTHSKNQVDLIAKSITEFGFVNPVLTRKGEVVAGHGRLMAAKQLGLKSLPVVPLDYLSAVQASAYLIADNKLTDLGGWDDDRLADVLAEIASDDEALLNLTGLNEREIEDITAGVLGDSEDAIPDEIVGRVKSGELWKLGRHYLYCADCLDDEKFKTFKRRALGGEKCDMVITDPPYNVGYIGKTKKTVTIENDKMPALEYLKFCEKIAENIDDICAGCLYVFGAPGPDGRILFGALDRVLHYSNTIVWVKSTFVVGRGKYQRRYEPCWFGWPRHVTASSFTKRRDRDDVWKFDRPQRSDEHPTMKPIPLFSQAIQDASIKGQVVVDLFSGSGTTIICCEHMDRRAAVFEIDHHYCDVAITRWELFTGKEAERVKI